MSKATPKTNAMRQLDAAKIPYEVLTALSPRLARIEKRSLL